MSTTRRTFVTLAAAAAASSLFAAPAFALGSLVDVELVDRSRSETLPTYRHRSADWVAGRPGSRYAVRLANRSAARVLVVLSVDGINAVSGETAAVSQTGYVLAPYQTTEITGWRKSMSEAAAFYFTALPDSYAARTDRPDHVGVVGVAVFRERARILELPLERRHEPSLGSLRRSDPGAGHEGERARAEAASPAAAAQADGRAADAAAKSSMPAREDRLGTGHGEREYAPTTHTRFDRAGEQPAEVVRIRYDSYANLLAAGVIRPHRAPPLPEAFPGFVPDPKG